MLLRRRNCCLREREGEREREREGDRGRERERERERERVTVGPCNVLFFSALLCLGR